VDASAYEQAVARELLSERGHPVTLVNQGGSPQAKGTEIWILNIACAGVSCAPLHLLSPEGSWILRDAPGTPGGRCLISTRAGDRLSLRVLSGWLEVTCSTHPHAGVLGIRAGDRLLREADLFTEAGGLHHVRCRVG
jgi:hypothetical protein